MTGTDSSVASADTEFQPLSALNDLLYCERRCGLHRIEQIWEENQFTLSGTAAHQRVHAEPTSEELGVTGKIVRGMWLRSERLRLIGKADVVEFRDSERSREQLACGSSNARFERLSSDVSCAPLRRQAGSSSLRAYPIEYKHGRRRKWDNDDVQLCAQALCLEEMLGVSIPAGAIFHVKSRRRREVAFGQLLREKTEQTARRLHELVVSGVTPPAVLKPQCDGCSLRELCMPEIMQHAEHMSDYVHQLYSIEAAAGGSNA